MSHDKTPLNPSRKATARVKNPLPAPEICPHCAGSVKVARHDEIYGQAYGEWPWAYLCTECRAYVGMHPFTNIPLGTLADAPLRKARKECKQPFEMLWQSKRMTRDEAYAGLAAHMGLEAEACHFGWFNVEQCERARDWAVSVLRTRPARLDDAPGPRTKVRCPDCGREVKRVGMANHRKDAHGIGAQA